MERYRAIMALLFYTRQKYVWGYIGVSLSIRPSVHPSVCSFFFVKLHRSTQYIVKIAYYILVTVHLVSTELLPFDEICPGHYVTRRNSLARSRWGWGCYSSFGLDLKYFIACGALGITCMCGTWYYLNNSSNNCCVINH